MEAPPTNDRGRWTGVVRMYKVKLKFKDL